MGWIVQENIKGAMYKKYLIFIKLNPLQHPNIATIMAAVAHWFGKVLKAQFFIHRYRIF